MRWLLHPFLVSNPHSPNLQSSAEPNVKLTCVPLAVLLCGTATITEVPLSREAILTDVEFRVGEHPERTFSGGFLAIRQVSWLCCCFASIMPLRTHDVNNCITYDLAVLLQSFRCDAPVFNFISGVVSEPVEFTLRCKHVSTGYLICCCQCLERGQQLCLSAWAPMRLETLFASQFNHIAGLCTACAAPTQCDTARLPTMCVISVPPTLQVPINTLIQAGPNFPWRLALEGRYNLNMEGPIVQAGSLYAAHHPNGSSCYTLGNMTWDSQALTKGSIVDLLMEALLQQPARTELSFVSVESSSCSYSSGDASGLDNFDAAQNQRRADVFAASPACASNATESVKLCKKVLQHLAGRSNHTEGPSGFALLRKRNARGAPVLAPIATSPPSEGAANIALPVAGNLLHGNYYNNHYGTYVADATSSLSLLLSGPGALINATGHISGSAFEQYGECPALFVSLTANGMNFSTLTATTLGCCRHFVKPLTPHRKLLGARTYFE